ncbi:hypothetical protein GGX14DRAFT_565683 [Mycena pura]|uniref:Uncharacterized protein n=1 Tax=Mycena pura TaxID=153505 RepID=A0AAD6YFF9_9AGAR|nr:hypothetical protein GGX14DRAFT_565683 [Mycena pura]
MPVPVAVDPAPAPAQGPPPIAARYQQDLDEILIHLRVKAGTAHNLPPPSKRRKVTARKPSDRIRDAARFFVCGLHLYRNVGCMLDDGAEMRWKEDMDLSIYTPEQAAILTTNSKSFDKFLSNIADLEPVLQHIYAHYNDSAWSLLVKELHDIAKQTRANDSNGFKHETNYLVPMPGTHVLVPPLSKGESKADRGFKHPYLARLLMPNCDRITLPPYQFHGSAPVPDLRTDEEKARGLRIQRRLDNRTYIAPSKLFPSFLYEEGSYRKDDPMHGLFRGPIVYRSIRHTWTAPESAITGLDHNGLPSSCHACMHKVYCVTPEIVGYDVCQVYLMLVPGNWKDSRAAIKNLYDMVLNSFYGDDVDDVWAEETLAFLQGQVFGHAAPPEDPLAVSSDDDRDEQDHMAQMRELARARRAEREAAAAHGGAMGVSTGGGEPFDD